MNPEACTGVQLYVSGRLLFSWLLKGQAKLLKSSGTPFNHAFRQAASGIADFIEDGQVFIQFLVTGGVRLPVTDIAVQFTRSSHSRCD